MNRPITLIRYADSEIAWRDVKEVIGEKIVASKCTRILEVGAGANPLFSEQFLKEHRLVYTALDISEEELNKAPDCYKKLVADICSQEPNITERFDFVFSRMLAEHVSDGARFHRNVFQLLAPGGRAFHFFPTMWAPPFVLNRFLPERLAELLLHALQRGRQRDGKHAKFPAFYSWCRGPVDSQIARLEALGYEIESYQGFFGHRDYYRKLPLIQKLHDSFVRWLIAHPMPWITSFAFLTVRKPL